MCGINGILSRSFKSREESVRAMNMALTHRGPDDEGLVSDGQITLGHKRLAIIGLSDTGKQPMLSDDGNLIIVYNGELYNYREIKSECSEYNFRSDTDTEVVLAAWKKWGENCVERFNGMFAFAIWDKKNEQLYLVRDRLGIKPLYYYKGEDFFAFSSELRALLKCPDVPKKIDQESLVDYLRYQTVHSPSTIISGVKVLESGSVHKVSDNQHAKYVYWKYRFKINEEVAGYQKTCENIRDLLQRSVERRLVSDVPFGAFLSGGIDSSIIVGLMSQVSSLPVKTFSIVFGEQEFSEAPYSRMIAKRFNTEHHEITLTVNDFLDQLPDALKAMDHPSGDGPNTYVVSKATKEAGITMALSGLGGDEMFAGYDVFRNMQNLYGKRWLFGMPLFCRKAIAGFLESVRPGIQSQKLAEILRMRGFQFGGAYSVSRKVLDDRQVAGLLTAPLVENVVAQIAENQAGKFNDDLHILSKVSLSEIYTYLQNVLLRDTDQMSMAHALEVRVPFLDHELVEYVLNVPDQFKYPVTPKKLLIDSVGDLIPKEVVNRPKMGFTFPWKHWMKNELKMFCENNIQSLSNRPFFNEKEVLAIWKRFLHGDPAVTWSRIWPLVVLENWLQINEIES